LAKDFDSLCSLVTDVPQEFGDFRGVY